MYPHNYKVENEKKSMYIGYTNKYIEENICRKII